MSYKVFPLNINLKANTTDDQAFPKDVHDLVNGCVIVGLAIRKNNSQALTYDQEPVVSDAEMESIFIELANDKGKGYLNKIPASLIQQTTEQCGKFEINSKIGLTYSKVYSRRPLTNDRQLELVLFIKETDKETETDKLNA